MQRIDTLKMMGKTFQYLSLSMAVAWFSHTAMADVLDPFKVKDSDFPARNIAKEELGKLLFSDKILSGNKNIACATCHHAFAATGDGLSLPVGEGGKGFGVTRTLGEGADAVKVRVPRHAPILFNVGANEFDKMFWDGKIEKDSSLPYGFRTPAGNLLPPGLDSALAGNVIFPMTSATEMAGQVGENPIADLGAKKDFLGVWKIYEDRLKAIPEYVDLFKKAFPDQVKSAADISIIQVGNAVAAFEAAAWRCTDSLFDRYVKDPVNTPVSKEVMEGALLFYGKGKCGDCHSGPFQTDQQYHNIASAQIGTGKGNNSVEFGDGLEDFGRELISKNPADRFKFKTPTLRQIGLTAPYGHAGAYPALEDMVSHYVNPDANISQEQRNNLVLPYREDLAKTDFVVIDSDVRKGAIVQALDPLAKGIVLTPSEIKKVVTFLREGLTDWSCVDLRRDVPARVPSGLPVYD